MYMDVSVSLLGFKDQLSDQTISFPVPELDIRAYNWGNSMVLERELDIIAGCGKCCLPLFDMNCSILSISTK